MSYDEINLYIPKENTYIFSTPLGEMLAVADPMGLHVLQFMDYPYLNKLLRVVGPRLQSGNRSSEILQETEKELHEYFVQKRKIFTIPFALNGTDFQIQAWKTLSKIPYGTTLSYQQEALEMSHPKAIRAVGTANGKNPLVIVIPCHRVLPKQQDGQVIQIGGYSSGTDRKKRLLELEGVL